MKMTRVNLVDPIFLTDKHLLAEYKEITQLLHLAKKSDMKNIPEKYTLGKGHCKFFYDKGMFILRRFSMLYNELSKRDFDLDVMSFYRRQIKIIDSFQEMNDYNPTVEALTININRIVERIDQKPNLYPDKDRFLSKFRNWPQGTIFGD